MLPVKDCAIPFPGVQSAKLSNNCDPLPPPTENVLLPWAMTVKRLAVGQKQDYIAGVLMAVQAGSKNFLPPWNKKVNGCTQPLWESMRGTTPPLAASIFPPPPTLR